MLGEGIDDDTDASVGYGKPPKHSQFKKGKSGNPKGRPLRKSMAETVLNALEQEVSVTLNGEKFTMTQQDAFIQVLITAAISGKSPAMKALLKLLKELPEYGV